MVQMHSLLLAGTDTITPWSITPRSLPLPRAISLMLWKVSFPTASLCLRLKKHFSLRDLIHSPPSIFFFARHGRRHLSTICRLFWGSLLRQTLLVSHLQARADRGSGVYTPPQERHPRLGTFPALWLRRRHDLPTREGRARPQRQQDCSQEPTHLSETLTHRDRTTHKHHTHTHI